MTRLASRRKLLLLAALLASASGCFGRPDTISIDGSSTVFPVSEKVKDMYVLARGSARVMVTKTGTSGGMRSFSKGEIDICDASRPMKEAERELCQQAGIEFTRFTVAYDGISLVVNKENDWCDCLTVEQLYELWRSDSPINRWSDLDPSWPDKPIKLFGPDEHSGTFQYFTEEILGKEETCRVDYSPSAKDTQLVRGVQGDKFALGYFGFAYYIQNADKLNLVGVDAGDGCFKPSLETIKTNTYRPLSRPLFIYVNNASLLETDEAAFVEFYLNNVGKWTEEVGYVPVTPEVAAENLLAFKKVVGSDAMKPAPVVTGALVPRRSALQK